MQAADDDLSVLCCKPEPPARFNFGDVNAVLTDFSIVVLDGRRVPHQHETGGSKDELCYVLRDVSRCYKMEKLEIPILMSGIVALYNYMPIVMLCKDRGRFRHSSRVVHL